MNLTENQVRLIVRQIVAENANTLFEMQKSKKIDAQIEKLLSNLQPELPEGSTQDPEMVKKEMERVLRMKIERVLQAQYEYPNFYIVKLGQFFMKDNSGVNLVPFQMPGFDKNFSFPYLYVYHDTAIVIRFGSGFYDSDEILIKMAKDFIKFNKINIETLSEKDQVILDDTFDTKNFIDLTDYSKIERPVSIKAPSLAKEKRTYMPGQRITHDKFGKGEITAVKKLGVDPETGREQFNVTVAFDLTPDQLKMIKLANVSEKEKAEMFHRESLKNTKTLRMQRKAKEVAA
jgi:hypothetical protein